MLLQVADALFGTIELPKALVIENRRLGLCHRILQVFAFGYVIYSCVILQGWVIKSVPMAHSLEVWTSSQTDEALSKAADYCSKPYVYNYSAAYGWKVTECIDLPSGEEVSKLGYNIFMSTMVRDRYITRRNGTADCDALNATCAANGGKYKKGEPCECVEERQGFVKHAEDHFLHINHGYLVNWPSSAKERGRDKARAERKSGSKAQWSDISGEGGEMRSVIQGPTGKRCKVGARRDAEGNVLPAQDVWLEKDVEADGIVATVRELLECAGESLDLPNEDLSSGLPTESGLPIPRIAGMNIDMDFAYHNADDGGHVIDGFHGVVCVITVSATPRWNSAVQNAYSSVPNIRTGAGELRSRKAYGITFSFDAKGSFSQFDIQALVSLIVNALVILAMPAAIVQFFALNCLGVLSEVYGRAQTQALNIERQLSGLTARMIGAMTAFRAVTGAEDSSSHIGLDKMTAKLRIALSGAIASGELDEKEFETLCEQVMKTMDTNKTGYVTCEEFLGAFSSEESLEPKNMVQLFDKDRKRYPLEVLFTPLRSSRSSSADVVSARVHPMP